MIELYEKYLEELLVKSGIKSRVCKSIDELKRYDSQHTGGIVLEKDKFETERKNKVFIQEKQQKKRIKKFSRDTAFLIIIGEYKPIACDKLFATFLSLIDRGIYDDAGNYVGIEIGEAEWLRDKDSLLRSSVVVQVSITFKGGLYKDYDYKTINWGGDGEYVKKI